MPGDSPIEWHKPSMLHILPCRHRWHGHTCMCMFKLRCNGHLAAHASAGVLRDLYPVQTGSQTVLGHFCFPPCHYGALRACWACFCLHGTVHMSGCGNFELSCGCHAAWLCQSCAAACASLFSWHYELNRCKNRWNTWGAGRCFIFTLASRDASALDRTCSPPWQADGRNSFLFVVSWSK